MSATLWRAFPPRLLQAYAMPNQAEGLTKVVLARRTDVSISGQLDPLALLEALQVRGCGRCLGDSLACRPSAGWMRSTSACSAQRERFFAWWRRNAKAAHVAARPLDRCTL